MVLSDYTIRELVETSSMIEGFDEDRLQPASYDMGIGEIEDKFGDTILKPGESRRVSTSEFFNLPDDVCALCKSKSSMARLMVEAGDIGGWIDPGYKGHITLAVVNLGDREFDLSTVKSLAQIVFMRTDRATSGYHGHYQDSHGLKGSILGEKDGTVSGTHRRP